MNIYRRIIEDEDFRTKLFRIFYIVSYIFLLIGAIFTVLILTDLFP